MLVPILAEGEAGSLDRLDFMFTSRTGKTAKSIEVCSQEVAKTGLPPRTYPTSFFYFFGCLASVETSAQRNGGTKLFHPSWREVLKVYEVVKQSSEQWCSYELTQLHA